MKASELGLNPINDGVIIRIPIPELTEERRRDLVKHVKKIAEDYRVSTRNHRRDANELIKELQADEELRAVPMMLVSNYEDSQAEAVKHGAKPGFGKAALGQPRMLSRVKPLLE